MPADTAARTEAESMPQPASWHRPEHPRSFGELRSTLGKDLYRYSGDRRSASAIKHFLFTPGFKFTVWMRLAGYTKRRKPHKYLFYPFIKFMMLRCQYKFGITISEDSIIGHGLFINRFGGIYFHKDVVLGRNVNVTHGVVLGQVNGGSRMGTPTIQDRVFLGSGAKVVGRVTVGSDCSIGANALVASDVPDKGVMAAPQAVMISRRGSAHYINRQA